MYEKNHFHNDAAANKWKATPPEEQLLGKQFGINNARRNNNNLWRCLNIFMAVLC